MSQIFHEPFGQSVAGPEKQVFELLLYVAGQTPLCLAAFDRLKAMCEENVPGYYHIQVIDLLKQPHLTAEDGIVVIPTVIRKLPLPVRIVVGDLADNERALFGLQIPPRPT